MSDDLVNGMFEAAGAVFVLLSVRQLLRDRELKGVDWRSNAFFTAWGLWNLHFYPSLGQTWSFAGAVAIVLANAWWLALVAHYKLQSRAAALDLQRTPIADIQAESPLAAS